MGEELVHAAAPTQLARAQWAGEQVDLIRATVAKDLGEAELAMFLEISGRHGLDPFIKEIWAYKKAGRVVIQASRDGLLGIANRHTPEGQYKVAGNGQFLGCSSDVVYGHDFFDKWEEEREDGTVRVRVEHRPRDADGEPTHGGRDGSARGERVGAWARVRRLGHDDTYFFAYANQYEKRADDGPVWGSHPHAMMQKCAESVVLRKAFSISGVIGEGELHPVQNLSEGGVSSSGEIEWPADEELAEALKLRFNALGYRQAKIRLAVNGKSDNDLRTVLSQLEAEITARGIEIPTDAEPVEAEVVNGDEAA